MVDFVIECLKMTSKMVGNLKKSGWVRFSQKPFKLKRCARTSVQYLFRSIICDVGFAVDIIAYTAGLFGRFYMFWTWYMQGLAVANWYRWFMNVPHKYNNQGGLW